MKQKFRRCALSVIFFIYVSSPYLAGIMSAYGQSVGRIHSLCAGVDRSLTAERATRLAQLVTIHLKAPIPPVKGTIVFDANADLDVKVLESLRYRGWSIILISTKLSDEGYLFYRQNPEKGKFVAVWGGSAPLNPDDPHAAAESEQEIVPWALREVPGVPLNLANCFAWRAVEGPFR